MFTIQYGTSNGRHIMQSFDSGSRIKLASHLARSRHPIEAVYEQASPITKAMQAALRGLHRDQLSQCAREFAFSQVTTPA